MGVLLFSIHGRICRHLPELLLDFLLLRTLCSCDDGVWQHPVDRLQAAGLVWEKAGDSCLHHHRCDPDLWRSEPVCRDVCSGPDPVHHVPGSGSSQTSDRGGPVCRVLHLHYDLPAGQPAADQYHPISVSRHAADGCARVRLHCGCGNVSDGLCILPVLRGPRQKKRGALVLPEGLRRFEIPDQ